MWPAFTAHSCRTFPIATPTDRRKNTRTGIDGTYSGPARRADPTIHRAGDRPAPAAAESRRARFDRTASPAYRPAQRG